MHEVDKKTMNPESDRMRSTRHFVTNGKIYHNCHLWKRK